jgi:hypothetical protein
MTKTNQIDIFQKGTGNFFNIFYHALIIAIYMPAFFKIESLNGCGCSD